MLPLLPLFPLPFSVLNGPCCRFHKSYAIPIAIPARSYSVIASLMNPLCSKSSRSANAAVSGISVSRVRLYRYVATPLPGGTFTCNRILSAGGAVRDNKQVNRPLKVRKGCDRRERSANNGKYLTCRGIKLKGRCTCKLSFLSHVSRPLCMALFRLPRFVSHAPLAWLTARRII